MGACERTQPRLNVATADAFKVSPRKGGGGTTLDVTALTCDKTSNIDVGVSCFTRIFVGHTRFMCASTISGLQIRWSEGLEQGTACSRESNNRISLDVQLIQGPSV